MINVHILCIYREFVGLVYHGIGEKGTQDEISKRLWILGVANNIACQRFLGGYLFSGLDRRVEPFFFYREREKRNFSI